MKKGKKIFIVVVTFFAFFINFSFANAATGTVTGNQVSFRNGAGTNSSVISYLNSGTSINIESDSKVSGTGCNDGWYKINYNGKSGYICSTYVAVAGDSYEASYARPWSTPKKAIIGGAKFISGDYISRGQNTSYLKKFNVNPNGYYSVYQHQYMANLAAPMNEAYSSFKSYRNNNLLSLPLHFVIPVFNSMPEYTSHPVTGKEDGGTGSITDTEFEKKLDEQKFDETYKKWLRALHLKYPNWTFEAMHTGLDFNYSVEREKWASSINKGSCAACVDSSNTNTEGNWYVASTQATGYFLDPRNFLMEDSILMFEDLSFNDYYKEETVKSVLAGTFMSSCDNVDKISYSSMFMEAGKKENVNPVYLASLSRQEVGTSMGLVTSGEKFDYKGITYIGFYNFYNIGAYSSAENPAKAGLVFASAGSSANSDGVYVGKVEGSIDGEVNGGGNNDQTKPQVTPVSTHLSNMKLNRKGSYLTNVSLNTSSGNLKKMTVSNEVTFKSSSNNPLGESEKISTGTKATFATGEIYEFVIYGDLTGDGNINSADLLKMRQYLLGQVNLNGAYLEAARVASTNGNINSADLLRLRQYLLGQKGINQA